MVLDKVKERRDWFQVYEDLAPMRLTAYQNLRTVYEDLLVVKQMKTSAIERIVAYQKTHGKKKENHAGEWKEKDGLLSWISCQLCYQRPIQATLLARSHQHRKDSSLSKEMLICQFRTD